MKNSEKHHKSEKSKKKPVQKLSSDASKVSIDQQVQTEQKSENNELKEMFTEKDNKKKEKKILEKVNRNETETRKRIMNNQ